MWLENAACEAFSSEEAKEMSCHIICDDLATQIEFPFSYPSRET